MSSPIRSPFRQPLLGSPSANLLPSWSPGALGGVVLTGNDWAAERKEDRKAEIMQQLGEMALAATQLKSAENSQQIRAKKCANVINAACDELFGNNGVVNKLFVELTAQMAVIDQKAGQVKGASNNPAPTVATVSSAIQAMSDAEVAAEKSIVTLDLLENLCMTMSSISMQEKSGFFNVDNYDIESKVDKYGSNRATAAALASRTALRQTTRGRPMRRIGTSKGGRAYGF